MNYIEDITLKFDVYGDYIVDIVQFRSTFFKDFKEFLMRVILIGRYQKLI